MKIKLGNKVKDIVTGFTGIAGSKVEYLNGCIQYGVKAQVDEKGAMPDVVYIDQEQLIVIPGGISIKQKETGGDMPDRPKQ